MLPSSNTVIVAYSDGRAHLMGLAIEFSLLSTVVMAIAMLNTIITREFDEI